AGGGRALRAPLRAPRIPRQGRDGASAVDGRRAPPRVRHLRPAPQAAPPATGARAAGARRLESARMAENGYLLFVWKPTGYELVDRRAVFGEDARALVHLQPANRVRDPRGHVDRITVRIRKLEAELPRGHDRPTGLARRVDHVRDRAPADLDIECRLVHDVPG